jgi:hypothetical protein
MIYECTDTMYTSGTKLISRLHLHWQAYHTIVKFSAPLINLTTLIKAHSHSIVDFSLTDCTELLLIRCNIHDLNLMLRPYPVRDSNHLGALGSW